MNEQKLDEILDKFKTYVLSEIGDSVELYSKSKAKAAIQALFEDSLREEFQKILRFGPGDKVEQQTIVDRVSWRLAQLNRKEP